MYKNYSYFVLSRETANKRKTGQTASTAAGCFMLGPCQPLAHSIDPHPLPVPDLPQAPPLMLQGDGALCPSRVASGS